MSYLITNDYLPQIQSTQLAQLITGNSGIRVIAENRAIAEVKSHLVQKYVVDGEFTDTAQWSNSATYYAANRIYLDATAYSAASTYALGALALYQGNVYKCTTAITTPEAWNASHWTLIGQQYSMFYGKYPKPLFDLYGDYSVGDQVFYNGHTYTCRIATSAISHSTALQYGNYSALPAVNIFPSGQPQSSTYWTDNGAYSIPAGTLPTNTTYWTAGDNRNQQILGYTIDIVLYYLHARIAPQNIPELRMDNYNVARQQLVAMADGDITLDMPRIQPNQGNRIRWGSEVRSINRY